MSAGQSQDRAPAVSVVMPVYNAAATLERAVASVLGQTECDLELVCVDDGSADGSPALLRAAAAADRRVRVLARAHAGIVDALNAGMAAARAPLIARMDADDESLPARLAAQRRFLDRHPGVGLVSCRVRYGGDPAAHRGYAAHVAWANGVRSPAAIARALFVESPLPHPSVMFRRSVWERWGGYRDGPFAEDYELWLRWAEAGVVMAKLGRELVVWNDPPGRLSRTDPRYDPELFHEAKAGPLARWLARHNPRHPEIVVWGAGRVARLRAELLVRHGVRIAAFVDIDPDKTGWRVQGRPVIAPAALPPPGRCFVVTYVGVRGARESIGAWLARHGWREGRDWIAAG